MPVYLDDRKLVKQLLGGDERAFDRFFDENFARLYRFALARLRDDPEAAREVVQISLTRAIRKLGSYRAEAALFTWLCAICRNETSEWLRRQGRYQEHIVLIEDHPEVRAAVDSIHASDDHLPDRQLQRAQSLRLIQVALDRLPAHYGDILEWKYVEGRSVKEIARRLHLGQEATQSLLARAKRAFGDVYSSLMNAVNDEADGLV
ncbi:MAG: RNA polymerase sigma factor [Woeseiaceae bacterium]